MHKGLKIAFVVGCVCLGIGGFLTIANPIVFDQDEIFEIENDELSDMYEYTNKEAIHTLKIHADISEIKIVYSDQFEIKTKGLPQAGQSAKHIHVSQSEEDGVYTFEEKNKRKNVSFKDTPEILIQVPKEVQNIDLDVNMGDVDIQNLTLATLHVRNDVGDVEIEQCVVDEVQCENHLGNIEYEGDFLKTMNVEANVGDVEISLARPMNEYLYNVDCKVGKLNVEGKNQPSNVQATSVLSGKVDVGDCDIEFGK